MVKNSKLTLPFRENVKTAQCAADNAEREKRMLSVELDDVRREQATTLKFETLTKTQCMQVNRLFLIDTVKIWKNFEHENCRGENSLSKGTRKIKL